MAIADRHSPFHWRPRMAHYFQSPRMVAPRLISLSSILSIQAISFFQFVMTLLLSVAESDAWKSALSRVCQGS